MAIARVRANAPSLADRVIAMFDEYRSAPDREAHDTEYVTRLRDQVRAYEQRFNINSSEIHARIEEGTLVESLDVCDWIFAVRRLELAEA